MKKDVIIIGAGAAGLMCAIAAGRRGRSVLVLEHTGRIGKKISVSGGGCCNFSNIRVDHEYYFSQNPHFCRSALSRFTPDRFIEMLGKHGIAYCEREEGRLFCKRSSALIVDMLRKECGEAGAEIRLNCRMRSAERKGAFVVFTNRGTFESESLVVATGGLSYPGLGATDAGYRVARGFGLKVVPTRPALVPLTFGPDDLAFFRQLSGISVDASARIGKRSFRGNILFTHRGLSGPAILQISSCWDRGKSIHLDLLPGIDIFRLFAEKKGSRMEMRNLLSLYLPRRLAQRWCELYAPSKPLCRLSAEEVSETVQRLHDWTIDPRDSEGYKKAEVTLGGVDTDELSSRTMEAKRVQGLYFAGEVIDVTGQLGGYNLHWAWASGYAAGQYA